MTSPAENVIEILENLSMFEWVDSDKDLMKDLKWCVNVIQSRKLYDFEVNTADKKQHEELLDWVTSNNYSKKPTTRFHSDNDLPMEKSHKESLLVLPRDVLQCFIHVATIQFDVFELKNRTNGNELVTMM